LVCKKNLLPLGSAVAFLKRDTEFTVKFRGDSGEIVLGDEASLKELKGNYCLRFGNKLHGKVLSRIKLSTYFFILFEGNENSVRAIIFFNNRNDDILAQLSETDSSLRLEMYDLPPTEITLIDTQKIQSSIFSYLTNQDNELFSYHAQKFLKGPHILTSLFAQVMSLKSKDQINYISTLRVISDFLREALKSNIVKLQRNHTKLWKDYRNSKVSFLDGGMSRIVGLPGIEPMGIRVGIYTVIPGCNDENEREEWNLWPYVIGDVISDKRLIEAENYETDTKRLQEASRYILEPLSALNYLERTSDAPRLLLLHGPLQNAFETYDERDPYFIPGVNAEFLDDQGITRELLEAELGFIPDNSNGEILWNGCIALYAYITKKISESATPIVGVVERAASKSISYKVLSQLYKSGQITENTRRKIWNAIKKYDLKDEILFGCVLDEGEYFSPVEIVKNRKNRAHDRWAVTVDNIPNIFSTMLKPSSNSFPFRVEMNKAFDFGKTKDIMSLIFHTSLLLPNYAFPVGLDIADKYAKVPDWLSRGLSTRLTANILSKTLQMGNDRLLRQVRQLLARSPRDFFYRPHS